MPANHSTPPNPLFVWSPPPSVEVAAKALSDLKRILRPPRKSGAGYKDPKLDAVFRGRLERMWMFLWNYTDSQSGCRGWSDASETTARAFDGGPWMASRLRKWSHDFIDDRTRLPRNIGDWGIRPSRGHHRLCLERGGEGATGA